MYLRNYCVKLFENKIMNKIQIFATILMVLLLAIKIFRLSIDINHITGDLICWYRIKRNSKREWFIIIHRLFPGENNEDL